MMTNNVEAIDENIIDLQLQEQALALAKRKLAWNASRTIMHPITNALVKMGIEPRIDDGGDYNIHCTGNKQVLLKLMRVLMSSGFRTGNDRPKPGQSSWCAWFDNNECKMRIWFSFSSSVCKQVQVGTKTVEIPVYETICGESISDAPELPPCETALISGTESTPALTQMDI